MRVLLARPHRLRVSRRGRRRYAGASSPRFVGRAATVDERRDLGIFLRLRREHVERRHELERRHPDGCRRRYRDARPILHVETERRGVRCAGRVLQQLVQRRPPVSQHVSSDGRSVRLHRGQRLLHRLLLQVRRSDLPRVHPSRRGVGQQQPEVVLLGTTRARRHQLPEEVRRLGELRLGRSPQMLARGFTISAVNKSVR